MCNTARTTENRYFYFTSFTGFFGKAFFGLSNAGDM